ncbi:MAG: hypothetical protein LBF16_03235 [Pseudomonadales bacterium]|nr:hypothetical protein [Pseudomonadales bacterium]
MQFNHRYLWSAAFITNLLRSGRLSEAATFRYFLAIMTFDWWQFTIFRITPVSSISLSSMASSWAGFAVTVLGLVYLYYKNGGNTGRQFLQRYFPLSLTVGWKFFVASFAVPWLLTVVLAGQSDEILDWSASVSIVLINILMFWRIGTHLKSLSHEVCA